MQDARLRPSVLLFLGVFLLLLASFWYRKSLGVNGGRADPKGTMGSAGRSAKEAISKRSRGPMTPPSEITQGGGKLPAGRKLDLPKDSHRAASFRTKETENRIREFVEDGVLSDELAKILLGEERDPQVLANQRTHVMALIQDSKADPLLRRFAIAALGLYRDDVAFSALLRLATDESQSMEIRCCGSWVVSTWSPERQEATDFLLRNLSADSYPLKSTALELLSAKRVEVPLNQLAQLALAEKGGLAVEAVGMLGERGGRDAIPLLENISANASSDGAKNFSQEALESIRVSGSFEWTEEDPFALKMEVNGKEVVQYPIDLPPPDLRQK
jgi:hypothetical protein